MKTISYDKLIKFVNPKDEDVLKIGDTVIIPFKNKDTEFVIMSFGLEDETKYMVIMSKEPLLKDIQWETERNSNLPFDHDDYENLDYLKSNVFKVLEKQIEYFPNEIKEFILDKYVKVLDAFVLSENRKIYKNKNIGKIWLPSIYELFGDDNTCLLSDDCWQNIPFTYFNHHPVKLKRCWTRSTIPLSNSVYGIDDIIPNEKRGIRECGILTYDSKDKLDCYFCLRIKLV